MGDLLILSPWSVSAQDLENTIWLLGFWHGRVLSVRRKTGAALCTLYFLFSPDNNEILATSWT